MYPMKMHLVVLHVNIVDRIAHGLDIQHLINFALDIGHNIQCF